MIVDDVAVVRVVGRFQNQNVVNTFHYQLTAVASAPVSVLTNLAITWDADHGAAWLARMSDAYELIGVKAFVAKGDAVPPGIVPVSISGDVVGDPQEAFVCRTLTIYTTSVNYRVRGRVMLSGGVESMFNDTDGSVTDTEITALQPLATSLFNDIAVGGDTWRLGTYNKVADTFSDRIALRPRKTPSVVRSRRLRQFMIG
ncbi:unnamed protein product [marine sediment metagenome]|uniref:Uncharacterized protein n=1 Tax=marine sediment metagenome TaxID=412755 RepID=X1EKQ6_9ZZZZ